MSERGGVPDDRIPPKICPEDGIPNFWVEDRIRTAKKTGGQNKDFFGGRPPGSGGRNTAQNKPELEDEIDPLTPSSNQASESNKIHL